jgi:hypothetical protein
LANLAGRTVIAEQVDSGDLATDRFRDRGSDPRHDLLRQSPAVN